MGSPCLVSLSDSGGSLWNPAVRTPNGHQESSAEVCFCVSQKFAVDDKWTLRREARILFCGSAKNFDPAGVLKIDKVAANVRQPGGMAPVALALQILPDEVEHGGERAEVVVRPKVKIEVLPHGGSVPCGR
jgi:hypothetical protein